MRISTFIAILLFGSNWVQAQTDGVGVSILNNDDFAGFEIFDSAVKNTRLVMTGENHSYVKYNAKVELKMLRYLNKTNGTRNFIIELGPARAHYLNRYINETDTFADRYLKATTSPRYMELFRRLRAFNRAQPDSLKIRVFGIDVERFNDLPVIRLAEILPKSDAPETIRVFVEAMQGMADNMVQTGVADYDEARDETRNSYYNYRTGAPYNFEKSIREFIKGYDSLRGEFKIWLADSDPAVNEAVSWLRQYVLWQDYENSTYQYIWREENIFRNLSALLTRMPSEKFYGQFGRCHVAYSEQNGDCGWFGYHSVVNKMKQRYFHSNDSVLTIGIFYADFQEYQYMGDSENDRQLKEEVEDLFDKAPKKSSTIYQLTKDLGGYPALAEKFSYVMVNTEKDLKDDDDTVETDIITPEIRKSAGENSYFYYAYQFTYSTANPDILGNHVALNGYSTSLGPVMYHEFLSGLNGSPISQQFRFAQISTVKLHNADSGSLKYRNAQMTYRMSYPLLNKTHVLIGLGAVLGYATESVKYSNSSTGFLQKNTDKVFVHRAFVYGPSAHASFRFGRFMYAGVDYTQLLDASSGQWRSKGGSQLYGEKGKVSSGFGASNFSVSLGFYIDGPYSSDTEWD